LDFFAGKNLGKREVEEDMKRERESEGFRFWRDRTTKLIFPMQRIASISPHDFFSYLAVFRTYGLPSEFFKSLAEGMQSQTLMLLSSFWMLSHKY